MCTSYSTPAIDDTTDHHTKVSQLKQSFVLRIDVLECDLCFLLITAVRNDIEVVDKVPKCNLQESKTRMTISHTFNNK